MRLPEHRDRATRIDPLPYASPPIQGGTSVLRLHYFQLLGIEIALPSGAFQSLAHVFRVWRW
jgi:hypothetical protein